MRTLNARRYPLPEDLIIDAQGRRFPAELRLPLAFGPSLDAKLRQAQLELASELLADADVAELLADRDVRVAPSRIAPSRILARHDVDRLDLVGLAAPYEAGSWPQSKVDGVTAHWMFAAGAFSDWLATDGQAVLCVDHGGERDGGVVASTSDETLSLYETPEGLTFSASAIIDEEYWRAQPASREVLLRGSRSCCVSVQFTAHERKLVPRPGPYPDSYPILLITRATVEHIAVLGFQGIQGAWGEACCWRR